MKRGSNSAGAGVAGGDDERLAVRWLTLGLGWTIVALAVGASSLATVVAGLPNDHYHAFADPMVIVLVAVGVAGLVPSGAWVARRGTIAIRSGGLAAALVAAGLIGWNLANQPPAAAADGGWAAARTAADRLIAASARGPIVISSLPTFKTDEALRMPLVADGAAVAPTGQGGSLVADVRTNLVIVCDQLFREAIGSDCGGAAEDAWLINPKSGLLPAGVSLAWPPVLIDRFQAAPGRWVSLYRPRAPSSRNSPIDGCSPRERTVVGTRIGGLRRAPPPLNCPPAEQNNVGALHVTRTRAPRSTQGTPGAQSVPSAPAGA